MNPAATIPARKLPRRSRTPSPSPRAFTVLAVCTTTCVVVTLGLGSLVAGGVSPFPPEIFVWVLAVAVVDLIPMPSDKAVRLELDLPILLAGVVIFGPLAGGVIAFLGAVDRRELSRSIPLLHALFNRSQTALSVMAAGTLFHGLGFAGTGWAKVCLGAALAIASDAITNYALVSRASSLLRGVSWRSALMSMRFGRPVAFFVTYASFGASSLLLIATHTTLGEWALLAFVLPLILARQAFHMTSVADSRQAEVVAKETAIARMADQIVEERRDERTRIASALHDEVLQGLYYVTLHARVIKEDLLTGRLLQLDDDLPGLMFATAQTSDAIRDIISGLRSSSLGPAGLGGTLNLLVQSLTNEHGLPIEAAIESVDMPPNLQLVLYQAAQEALHNAVKHANARQIRITMYSDQEWVRLSVSDDGDGFVVDLVDHTKHFGLALMRERIEAMRGDVCIETEPQGGTVVAVRVPRSLQ